MRNFIYRVIDVLQILGLVIALVAETIALIEYWRKDESYRNYVVGGVIVVTAVFLILIAKFWEMAVYRYNLYAKIFHKFNHILRDETYHLEILNKQGKLTPTVLKESIKNTGFQCVELLQDLLSKVTNKEISVHLKHFPDFEKAKKGHYRTLCISTYSDTDRKTVHDHPIEGNTMMERIVIGRSNHFFSNNLKKYIREYESTNGQKFKISYHEWDKWFNSVIVVPIRIHSSLRLPPDDTKYEYLGFLCCDAKEKNAFSNSEIKGHLDMIKAFADGMFVYLDTISKYSE